MDTTPTKPTLPATLTQDGFAAVAEHCYQAASDIVARGKEALPVLIAGVWRNGKLDVSFAEPAMTRTDAQKNRLARRMNQLVQRPQIDFVAYVTEAWILATPDPLAMRGSIANHPQREEVVLFSILSKDCQLLVINPLHRNPSRLERGTLDFDRQIGGRFARSAPPRH